MTQFFTTLFTVAAGKCLVVSAGATTQEGLFDAKYHLKHLELEAEHHLIFAGATLPLASGGLEWQDLPQLVTSSARSLDEQLANELMLSDWSPNGENGWAASVEPANENESAFQLCVSFDDGLWWLNDSREQGSDAFLLLRDAIAAGNDTIENAEPDTDGFVIVFREDGCYNSKVGSGFPTRELHEAAVYSTQEAAAEAGASLHEFDILPLGDVLRSSELADVVWKPLH